MTVAGMRAQFLVVVLLLSFAAVTLRMRGDTDLTPSAVPLDRLPTVIGSWKSVDVPIDPSALRLLGDGRFLNRVYYGMPQSQTGGAGVTPAPLSLFIGYFPSQRTGQSIHSPQNCLPGAGWSFESAHPIRFQDNAGKSYTVGEYVITDGSSRQEVLYWYRSHGRSIASDYRAKFYMIADAIRYQRTDGALIRIITPILNGESQEHAHQRAVQFAGSTAPLLPAYIPD